MAIKKASNITAKAISVLKKNGVWREPPQVKKPTDYKSVEAYNTAVEKYNEWVKDMNAKAKDLLELAEAQKKGEKGVGAIVKRKAKKD